MACRILPFAVAAALIVALAGCSNQERPQRPAWRTQAENACLARGLIRSSAFIQPAQAIDGPGICGLTRPFKVSALQDGAVTLGTTATLDCSMTAALDDWVSTAVQPAARARFGVPIAEIHSMGAYSCRSMNNQPGARLSEHAFGNALDIGGFRLADGRDISIMRDWTRGDEGVRAFLQDIHAGACGSFTTVLGPGSDMFHYNHIHLDLAMHGNTSMGPRRVCKPRPQQTPVPQGPRDGLPEAPEIEDEIEIAQARQRGDRPASIHAGPGPAPVAAVPAAVVAPLPKPRAVSAFAPIPAAPVGVATLRAPRDFPEGKPSDWDLRAPGRQP
jgi:hypothetical protein